MQCQQTGEIGKRYVEFYVIEKWGWHLAIDEISGKENRSDGIENG